ncbi:MAG: tRNA pseudouridine(55) synthase TruB [Bacteroidales bacterium]|nr:MAG: tRNA pseudouridine(55) synthase TruB [Bacteroidales bacterium]
MDFIKGELILIDKPLNWTSFDVVKKIRRNIIIKLNKTGIKVGHAGTLDPLATGLMIICTGKLTKEISKYQEYHKEYIATLKLGATTPSFDLETDIDKTYPVDHIDEVLIHKTLKDYTGELYQIPPSYSAKFINGIRAYKYARSGKEINLKPSRIYIKEIKIIKFELPVLEIKVICSKGTYIRSLVRDIGKSLNSGAHLIKLVRTAIGEYKLNEAISIEDFERQLKFM